MEDALVQRLQAEHGVKIAVSVPLRGTFGNMQVDGDISALVYPWWAT